MYRNAIVAAVAASLVLAVLPMAPTILPSLTVAGSSVSPLDGKIGGGYMPTGSPA
jgi:hypothetical protein